MGTKPRCLSLGMSLDVMESSTLSEDQIDQLLQEAEARLRSKTGTSVATHSQDELTLSLNEDKPEFAKRQPIPSLQHGLDKTSYIQDHGGVAQIRPELLASTDQQKLADQLRPVDIKGKSKKEDGPVDAGKEWFNMPLTTVTPALKRDLQLIQMRSVLDPHRHYKKKNFVEEAMATERDSGRFKRKYAEIQAVKTSGKKAHYK